jgi:hypothetical protein
MKGRKNARVDVTIEELSNVLWRERQLLELLAYKLTTERLLLAANEARWLHAAAREVEHVLGAIQETELMRAALTEDVGHQLGLGPNPSLRQLCDRAPAPWDSILDDHRVAFLELTEGIQADAQTNRDLLVRAQQAARDAVAWFEEASTATTGTAGTYARSGRSTERSAHLFDQVL